MGQGSEADPRGGVTWLGVVPADCCLSSGAKWEEVWLMTENVDRISFWHSPAASVEQNWLWA